MENDCIVIDLIEERLKRYIDSFYQGSEEWSLAMQVLFMYMSGEIDVSWCAEGIKVTHPSITLQEKNPEKEYNVSSVVLPPHGMINDRQ